MPLWEALAFKTSFKIGITKAYRPNSFREALYCHFNETKSLNVIIPSFVFPFHLDEIRQ